MLRLCPLCGGWQPDETGMDCWLCENTGEIWEDDQEPECPPNPATQPAKAAEE